MSQKRHAFTLIELLTVVAIITLLISILVPAVNAARKQAARAAARAQISGLSQGIEMFRTDFNYYPSSIPQTELGVDDADNRANSGTGTTYPVQGAHRLAVAMVGLDQLGCPTKTGGTTAGNINVNPDSIKGWYYTHGAANTADGTFIAGSDVYYPKDTENWGNPVYRTTRRSPYIDPKGFNIVKDKTIGNNGNAGAIVLTDRYDKRANEDIQDDANYSNHSVILYYAANERGKYLYRDNPGVDDDNISNLYYFQDNRNILVSDAAQFKGTSTTPGYSVQAFYDFIEDKNAAIGTGNVTHMPINKDSFILISRGYDGVYGTDDDVTNYKD
jgi:prepilin-type N-terminal cleavage/methylation domain-containing protein